MDIAFREVPMIGRRHLVVTLIAGGVVLAGILPAQEHAAEPTAVAIGSAQAATPAAMRWTDPDGKPLPFKSDDELLEFLREAQVVDIHGIGEGITQPRRLTLERNGVRARAVFRNVQTEELIKVLPGNKREFHFRDSFDFEPVAYRLGLLLGVDNIPPATLRRLNGEPGSVQVWVEKAMTEERRRQAKSDPPDTLHWQRQLQMMIVWDALVGNSDRNQGNHLYTPDWQMWLIDHTRAFPRSTDLKEAKKINWSERGFWEKLRTVGDAEIVASVHDGLKPEEISSLLERRKKLVALIDGLIRERGEGAVLFTWSQ